MKYSFVIPLYNEEGSLEELYEKVCFAGNSLKMPFEIIFIDDGSTDSSSDILLQIQNKDRKVKVIKFRVNYGKSTALKEGFNLSSGEIVITLDADLQDDPAEIKNLIKKMDEGYDMVSSWKKNRNDPLSKTIPSKIFNFVVGAFSGIKLHDFNSGLKVYKKEVLSNIQLYGELHRFIPVIVFNQGFKITEIPVVHHVRKFGVSKYGFSRIPKGFFDFLTVLFLTKYESHPLHFFGFIGSLMTFLGIIFGIYLTYLRFSGYTIGNRPLLFLTMLLIVSGLQFIFTGLLAEFILHLSPKKHTPVMTISESNNEK